MTETEKSPAEGTATDPTSGIQGPFEPVALKALQFYASNYTNLMFRGLGGKEAAVVPD